MDYKLLLMQILTCVGEQEGVVFENYWDYYGVSEEDKETILKELDIYYQDKI